MGVLRGPSPGDAAAAPGPGRGQGRGLAAQGPQIPPRTRIWGSAGLCPLRLWGPIPDFFRGGTEGVWPAVLGLAPGTTDPPEGRSPKAQRGRRCRAGGAGGRSSPGPTRGGPGPVLGALPVGPGREGPNSTEKPALGASGARISLCGAAAPKRRVLPVKRAPAAGGSRRGRTGATDPE